ncbi:MAG: type II toxin-antitoxin system mRNA interferase toxin, RelE/StbE family [Candidatus Nomurabacteria bacterium]|nr:type II toxin-antitoxin system mRNA interferase toxin, RelE/StbE family [Candidatus Nomurabacteria bacterium]
MIFGYSHSFKKDYKKLPPKIKKQLGIRIEIFKLNQFDRILNNHAVHHPYTGCRSINITGDLRALYEVDGDKLIFIRIGTHSELYE